MSIAETHCVSMTLLGLVCDRSRPGWGGIQASEVFSHAAAELGMTEAQVAFDLKAARLQGLVEQTNPRPLQAAFISTEKGRKRVEEYRARRAAAEAREAEQRAAEAERQEFLRAAAAVGSFLRAAAV
jgi:hypothetical protein